MVALVIAILVILILSITLNGTAAQSQEVMTPYSKLTMFKPLSRSTSYAWELLTRPSSFSLLTIMSRDSLSPWTWSIDCRVPRPIWPTLSFEAANLYCYLTIGYSYHMCEVRNFIGSFTESLLGDFGRLVVHVGEWSLADRKWLPLQIQQSRVKGVQSKQSQSYKTLMDYNPPHFLDVSVKYLYFHQCRWYCLRR